MQMSLYLHLLLLLNAEAPRKDHWQMMTHHVVTTVLIVASYAYNLTRVGCLIMVIMDWCDIFFPVFASSPLRCPESVLTFHLKLAKMLVYLRFQPACDIAFVWWMLSWFVTRHALFCKVIAAIYWDLPNEIEFGWWPERGHFFTEGVHKAFFSLLVVLEVSVVPMVHDAANFAFVLDHPECLVLPDMWRGISRTKG